MPPARVSAKHRLINPMQEIRYKLIWMGQQLGPYTKTEIDQQLANNEIGRSHIVELPTGDRLPLGEFMDQLQAPQPQAAQTTGDSQQFYLAIGSQPQGPYSTQENAILDFHQDYMSRIK